VIPPGPLNACKPGSDSTIREFMTEWKANHQGNGTMKNAAPSATYRLIAKAMAERKQVLCSYDGYPRELCPIVLGHSQGEEMALVYQFAGGSRSGLPSRGQWKCLRLAKMRDVRLRDGPWRTGSSHRLPQACVEVVDLDVNPVSPYKPRRHLSAMSQPSGRRR
jgi:hypothetical protein